MAKAKEIFKWIEITAPRQLQEEYDNSGLQAGDPNQEVTNVLVTLDVTPEVVDEAIRRDCQMIVSHHPVLFHATKCIDPTHDYISLVLWKAIRHGIVLYAAHTNLDNALGGVNYRMAEILDLRNVRPLAPLPQQRLEGLSPEMCKGCGSGVIGDLPEPMSAEDLMEMIKEQFEVKRLCSNLYEYSLDQPITTLALCGGAGAEFIAEAKRQKAQAFLTGEVRYHEYFGNSDLLVIEAGHYETEQYTRQLLCDLILQGNLGVRTLLAKQTYNPRCVF